MSSRASKLLIVTCLSASVADAASGGAQTLKKEPGANDLACGQKVLVENNTCPPGQILEVTGSCLNTIPTIEETRTPRGTQYNCITRKRE